MKLDEYASFDATALADLVRRKQVQAGELTALARRAIELINPTINAVVATIPDAAVSVSRASAHAPFDGVPFLIKDLGLFYAGVPSEGGSRLLAGVTAPHDSELAVRHKAAGLVTIARTNTPEFGNSASTEPIANGPTRNPWDLGRSAGGSSGGSAAAVAAGMVPMAHASDGGGSIRVPASNCGVFGLKPSRARNPSGPDVEEVLFGLVNDHVVSRSVRDSAAMLDATAGNELGSRILIAPPSQSFLAASRHDPARLRIAFATCPGRGAGSAHADCVGMIKDVASLCEDLGHDVTEAAPDIDADEVAHVFLELAAATVRRVTTFIQRGTGRPANRDTLEATTLRILDYAESRTVPDLLDALEAVHRISVKLGSFFATCDIWLSPTLAIPPPLLGYFNADDPALSAAQWIARFLTACPYTAMFNQSGQPAMSVPLHWSADGLPIGSHFAARVGAEEVLFSLAGQLERARPWVNRRPNVHVANVTGPK